MERSRLAAGLLSLAGLAAFASEAGNSQPKLVARARLEMPPSLGARELSLGSIFSDLFRDPKDPVGTFWAVTDRGPNGEVSREGVKRRTFAYPAFSPSIVRVVVKAQILQVAQTIPLRGSNGAALSGLPNRPGIDEEPYDCTGSTILRYDPSGLDTEGLVRLPTGDFWLAEEYGPSLVRVTADGVVRERLVPKGAGIVTDAYPVRETLPAVFSRRTANRGFESLALSADHQSIFTILQSPLGNPRPATAKTSRITRLLRLDAQSGLPLGEFAIVLEDAAVFGAASQADIKISAAVWVGQDRLLIDQRTDERARVYELDLRGATNLLGSSWDEEAQPELETLAPGDLARNGVIATKTTLLVDLASLIPNLPGKIEGLALVDPHTLVVGNDNEFAFSGCDSAQNAIPLDRPNELLFVRLPRALR